MNKNSTIDFIIAAYFFTLCTPAMGQEVARTQPSSDINPLDTVIQVPGIQQIIFDYTNKWQHKTQFFLNHPVTALAFLSHANILVTGTEDGTVTLWDKDQNNLDSLTHPSKSKITAIIAVSDKKFISACEAGFITEWRLTEQNTIESTRDTNTHCPIDAFSYDPINHQCVIADMQNGAIRLYNLNTEQVQKTKTFRQALVTTLAYSPDGKYIATGARQGGGKLWSLSDNEPFDLTQHADYPILSISWLANNKLITMHDEPGSIQHIDITNTTALEKQVIAEPTDIGHTAQVYVPQTHQLITADTENRIQLWDIEKRTCSALDQNTDTNTDTISSLAVSPDGQYLACGSENEKSVTLYQHQGQLAALLKTKKLNLA